MAKNRPLIDWGALTKQGSTEDKWREDRLRKFGRIKIAAAEVLQQQTKLKEAGALYRCTPALLRQFPSSALWYIRLAGFAGKTLQNIQQRARDEFGLSVLPETFLGKLEREPEGVTDKDCRAFADWINAELADVIGDGLDDSLLAGLHVAMIAGGTVLGQGQNEGGDVAVQMLKQALLSHFGPANAWGCSEERGKASANVGDDLVRAMALPYWFHQPSGTVFDFCPGGNRPDITVLKQKEPLVIGEIKGRKDLSNLWESWIPQVVAHMESWSVRFPQALRGVFMTVVTEEAITGVTSTAREKRRALKALHEEGKLDFAINLSLLATNDAASVTQLKAVFSSTLRNA